MTLLPDTPDNSPDPLGLSANQMRQLAHQVIDLILDHIENKGNQPAIHWASRETLEERLGGPVPTQSSNPFECVELLVESALSCQQHGDHPRYFARVPGPASFMGILGEWLTTGFNSMSASWQGSSGPTTLELTVTRWLSELLGLPDSTDGVLVSGGSMANLTALGVARQCYGSGIVYCSDQTHSSIHRGLMALGFDGSHTRALPTDEQFRLSISHLKQAIQSDIRSGQRPVAVVATAGTTNTGAIDPLRTIGQLCRQHDIWFHVDGAYGAPAAMIPSSQSLFDGLELADSVAVDPHKWLFQPYDIGCTLVTRSGALEQTYSMNPEYLRDVKAGSAEVDMRNRSLELTRKSRAVKLWLTIQVHGIDQIRNAIQRGIDLSEFAERELVANSDLWHVVTPAQLGIITFARNGASKADHQRAVQLLAKDGFAAVTSTELKGRSVLRLCTINPRTTEDDIRETLKRLAEFATPVSSLDKVTSKPIVQGD